MCPAKLFLFPLGFILLMLHDLLSLSFFGSMVFLNTAFLCYFYPANRAVEVNEMWHSRKKELEMENQHKGRQRDESKRVTDQSSGSTNRRHYADDASSSGLQSSSKRMPDTYYSGDEEGLKDEELEQFLHSR